MNILQRIWNRVRWKPERRTYIGPRQAGVVVNEDTAQACSTVAACVRIISETLASLPWCVYRKLQNGREELPSNPIAWLLESQPNPEQTAMVFKRQLLAHYLLWGNGYAEIERGQDGRAIWLWPLLPDRTEIKRSETGALVCETHDAAGQKYVVPREDVYHLGDGSYDGLVGLSRVQLARRSIGASIAQDVFTSSFYENGAAVGGVIEQKQGKTMTPEAVEELLKSFNDKYAGPARGMKTVYLDAGMEYTPIDMPLTDAQFIESRRFAVEEICRWFGVPQHLVQMLVETNYAISYTADKNFVEHTLRPIATLMEQEANVRLFGARSRGSVYTRINLRALMRGDPKVRGEWYKAMINAGVMAINEVRALEEMNSIGAEGDEHYLQTNMSTLKRIADGTNNVAQPASPPAPDETPTAQAERLVRAAGAAMVDVERVRKAPQAITYLQPTFKAGDTHIAPQPITVNAPPITVEPTPVTVENHTSVEVLPTPVTVENHNRVDVAPTPVTVENNTRVEVQPTPVTVENHNSVDVAPTPVTIRNRVEVAQETETVTKHKRDQLGEIEESRARTRVVR
jgi:HK97 family phage portal protein